MDKINLTDSYLTMLYMCVSIDKLQTERFLNIILVFLSLMLVLTFYYS